MPKLYISTLICGNEDISFISKTLEKLDFEVGIEYFCFKLTENEKQNFENIYASYPHLPATLHAPMVGTEGTSEIFSNENNSLLENYDEALKICKTIGAKEIVFHTNECAVPIDMRVELKERAEKNAIVLNKKCLDQEVTLLMETLATPNKGTLFFDKEYVNFILENDLHSIVDLGHMNINGYDLEYVLSNLKGKIVAYHVHNNNGLEDSHKGIFEGTFDYVRFAYFYKKYTPNANLVFEYGDTERTPEEFASDIKYFKKLVETK